LSTVTRVVRFLGGPACACVFLLTSCGSQAGAPQFVQAFGAVDSPCAVQAAPLNTVQHCTGHVVLQNQGGEGYGHLTILVQVKDAKAGSAPVPPVKCGSSIPDTPAGGYSDLVCNFDLAAGQTLVTYPVVQSIDFVGASSRGSTDPSSSAISTLILTAATALLALASLVVVARAGRRPIAAEADATESSSPPSRSTLHTVEDVQQQERRRIKPGGPDTEYDLPALPR